MHVQFVFPLLSVLTANPAPDAETGSDFDLDDPFIGADVTLSSMAETPMPTAVDQGPNTQAEKSDGVQLVINPSPIEAAFLAAHPSERKPAIPQSPTAPVVQHIDKAQPADRVTQSPPPPLPDAVIQDVPLPALTTPKVVDVRESVPISLDAPQLVIRAPIDPTLTLTIAPPKEGHGPLAPQGTAQNGPTGPTGPASVQAPSVTSEIAPLDQGKKSAAPLAGNAAMPVADTGFPITPADLPRVALPQDRTTGFAPPVQLAMVQPAASTAPDTAKAAGTTTKTSNLVPPNPDFRERRLSVAWGSATAKGSGPLPQTVPPGGTTQPLAALPPVLAETQPETAPGTVVLPFAALQNASGLTVAVPSVTATLVTHGSTSDLTDNSVADFQAGPLPLGSPAGKPASTTAPAVAPLSATPAAPDRTALNHHVPLTSKGLAQRDGPDQKASLPVITANESALPASGEPSVQAAIHTRAGQWPNDTGPGAGLWQSQPVVPPAVGQPVPPQTGSEAPERTADPDQPPQIAAPWQDRVPSTPKVGSGPHPSDALPILTLANAKAQSQPVPAETPPVQIHRTGPAPDGKPPASGPAPSSAWPDIAETAPPEELPSDRATPPAVGPTGPAAPQPISLPLQASPPPSPPQQTSQMIVFAAKNGQEGPIEIALRPEELGHIRFEITSSGDRLHVNLVIERPEAQDLIRRNIDQLLADLRQAGFAQTSFSFGQWAQKDNRQTAGEGGFRAAGADLLDQPESPPTPHATQPSSGVGRLDLRL